MPILPTSKSIGDERETFFGIINKAVRNSDIAQEFMNAKPWKKYVSYLDTRGYRALYITHGKVNGKYI